MWYDKMIRLSFLELIIFSWWYEQYKNQKKYFLYKNEIFWKNRYKFLSWKWPVLNCAAVVLTFSESWGSYLSFKTSLRSTSCLEHEILMFQNDTHNSQFFGATMHSFPTWIWISSHYLGKKVWNRTSLSFFVNFSIFRILDLLRTYFVEISIT